jgi:hypothetical protein
MVFQQVLDVLLQILRMLTNMIIRSKSKKKFKPLFVFSPLYIILILIVVVCNIVEYFNIIPNSAMFVVLLFTASAIALFNENIEIHKSKDLWIIFIFFVMSQLYNISEAIHLYKAGDVINEVVNDNVKTSLTWNNYNQIFILNIENVKQPVIAQFNNNNSYNSIKAKYLDDQITIEKRKIKAWFDETAATHYYIDGYIMR